MFKLSVQEGRARRGEFHTIHGTVKTPVFMNVGTSAAIKGGVSSLDLEQIGCQMELSNTYHLHLRPGDDVIHDMGGIHKFMNWNKPILTDSGGFQVFSLAPIRQIREAGVTFASHIDGRRIFMGPEESMQIQSNLGSTVAMAFDECMPSHSDKDYARASTQRTERWLLRCKDKIEMLNKSESATNKNQMLFGINQGALFEDIRIENMKNIAKLDLSGYAVGGLAVGETHQEMYGILDCVLPHAPEEKPRYLMGVGTPANIIESVARGIDFFDCVMPSRNARHGHLFTGEGIINIMNQKYMRDALPIEPGCVCPACSSYSRAYIRHLMKAGEILGMRLCVLHNLYFYNKLMERIRSALENGCFEKFREENGEKLAKRI